MQEEGESSHTTSARAHQLSYQLQQAPPQPPLQLPAVQQLQQRARQLRPVSQPQTPALPQQSTTIEEASDDDSSDEQIISEGDLYGGDSGDEVLDDENLYVEDSEQDLSGLGFGLANNPQSMRISAVEDNGLPATPALPPEEIVTSVIPDRSVRIIAFLAKALLIAFFRTGIEWKNTPS